MKVIAVLRHYHKLFKVVLAVRAISLSSERLFYKTGTYRTATLYQQNMVSIN